MCHTICRKPHFVGICLYIKLAKIVMVSILWVYSYIFHFFSEGPGRQWQQRLPLHALVRLPGSLLRRSPNGPLRRSPGARHQATHQQAYSAVKRKLICGIIFVFIFSSPDVHRVLLKGDGEVMTDVLQLHACFVVMLLELDIQTSIYW